MALPQAVHVILYFILHAGIQLIIQLSRDEARVGKYYILFHCEVHVFQMRSVRYCSFYKIFKVSIHKSNSSPRVSSKTVNFFNTCATISSSKMFLLHKVTYKINYKSALSLKKSHHTKPFNF